MVVVELMNEAPRNKGTKQDHWGHDQKQRKEYGPHIWTKYKPASEAESLQQVFIFEELRSGEIKVMSYDNAKFNRENKSCSHCFLSKVDKHAGTGNHLGHR
jgi:hypothetical protein